MHLREVICLHIYYLLKFSYLFSSSVSTPTSQSVSSVFRFRDNLLSPEGRSSKRDPGRPHQLSSKEYIGEPSILPSRLRISNGLLLSEFLQIAEDDFDPLFFTFPNNLQDEITERQIQIASDWPLVVPSTKVYNLEDKELVDSCNVQAQISNAAQMVMKMIRAEDLLAALQYAMDIYALSTRAATVINNKRTALRFPGAMEFLDVNQHDVVRPQAKEILQSYKTLSTMKKFFLEGGETKVLSPQFSQSNTDSGLSQIQQSSNFFSNPVTSAQNAQEKGLLSSIYSTLRGIELAIAQRPQTDVRQPSDLRRKSFKRFNFRGKRTMGFSNRSRKENFPK
jgi:hypothetical protein